MPGARTKGTESAQGRKIPADLGSLDLGADEPSSLDEAPRDSKQVIQTVDRINKRDAEGKRRVRIHGIGFPTLFSNAEFSENTGVRFATLMRILCRENDGAFVGVSLIR